MKTRRDAKIKGHFFCAKKRGKLLKIDASATDPDHWIES
jgi:hypothetical protein